MRKTPSSFGGKYAVALALSVSVRIAAGAGIPATWIAPQSGNWSLADHWSTGVSPNNGTPEGATYDASVTAVGGPYTVTLSGNAALDSLTLGGADTVFAQQTGTLTIDHVVDLGDATYILGYASTIRGGTLTATGAGSLQMSYGSYYQNYRTLDGVTLDAPIIGTRDEFTIFTSTVQIRNGLTLPRATATLYPRTTWAFVDGSTLSGNCVVTLAAEPLPTTTYTNSSLSGATIAPGITLRTDPLSVYGGDVIYSSFTNYGTICVYPRVKTWLSGNWDNRGTILLSEGTLNLGGTFTPSNLGAIQRTGGTLSVRGYLENNNTVFSITRNLGPLEIAGNGTIHGGTITGDGSALLTVSGGEYVYGTFDGVTLNTKAVVVTSGHLMIRNNLMLQNGTITLSGGAPTYVQIYGNPGTTRIEGTGVFVLEGQKNVVQVSTQGTTWGSGLTIRTGYGGGSISAGPGTENYGLISADMRGQCISLSEGTLTNHGTISAVNGGTIVVGAAAKINNLGTVLIDHGALMIPNLSPFSGTFTRRDGQVVLNGAGAGAGGIRNLNSPVFGRIDLGPLARVSQGTLTCSAGVPHVVNGYRLGSSDAATLDGVTLATDLVVEGGQTLQATNNLTLANATIHLGDGWGPATLRGGPMTGSGTITFDNERPSLVDFTVPSGTIGSGITIRTGTGNGEIKGNSYTAFNGLISCDGPGRTITVSGMRSNGTLSVSNGGTLDLRPSGASGNVIIDQGVLLIPALPSSNGTVTRNGGTVILSGYLASNVSPWDYQQKQGLLGRLDFGGKMKVYPGTLTSTTGTPYVFRTSTNAQDATTLDGVTLATDLLVQDSALLKLIDAFTFQNATISLGSSTGGATLDLSGVTSFGGAGSVRFEGATPSLITSSGTQTLSIGADVAIRTGAGSGTITTTAGIDNLGTISAETPGQTITIRGPIANHGTLGFSNGGVLLMDEGMPTAAPALARPALAAAPDAMPADASVPRPGLCNDGVLAFAGGVSTIQTPVTNNPGGRITVQSGTVVFAGGLTNLGTLTVAGGRAHLAAAVGGITGPLAGTLVIAAGGSVQTSAFRQQSVEVAGTLQVEPGNGPSVVQALAVAGACDAWSGRVDLADTGLIVQSRNPAADYATLRNLIVAGRHGGEWDGPGLTSSTAANDVEKCTGLALAQGSDLFAGEGLFEGERVDADSLLVKYTWLGDANLDGQITADDYLALDAGFRSGGTTYVCGDFNYDGQVTRADYALIDASYVAQSGWLAAEPLIAQHAALFGNAYGVPMAVTVPEPASLGLLGFGGLLLLLRGRRAMRS